MKFKNRLYIIFGFFILSVIIVSGVSFYFINQLEKRIDYYSDIVVPTLETVDDMIIINLESSEMLRDFIFKERGAELDMLKSDLDNKYNQFHKLYNEVEASGVNDLEVREDLVSAKESFNRFYEGSKRILDTYPAYLDGSLSQEELDIMEKGFIQVSDYSHQVSNYLNSVSEVADQISDDADEDAASLVTLAYIITILFLLLICLSAIIIVNMAYKSFILPINNLSSYAKSINKGDFTAKLKHEGDEEFKKLEAVFSKTVESIQEITQKSPSMKKYLKIIPQFEELKDIEPIIEPVYELEFHKTYYVGSETKAFGIFLEKINKKYQGLLISRTDPKEIREKYGLEKTAIVHLGDSKEKELAITNLDELFQIIVEFTSKSKKSIIFLERIDFLIMAHGFDKVYNFISKIHDIIKTSKSIGLVLVDSQTLEQTQYSMLTKELNEIPVLSKDEIDQSLFEIVSFVENENKLDKKVSYNEIRKQFNITYPTVKKRVNFLLEKGYLEELKVGRAKVLRLTKKGKALL